MVMMTGSSDPLPAPTFDTDTTFVDIAGREVSIVNTVFDNDYNVFDVRECRFSPFGDFIYRGRLYSPKENLDRLSPMLKTIYEKHYRRKPNPPGDFSNYRSKDRDSSGSQDSHDSNGSEEKPGPQQNSGDHDPHDATADGTDAASLLQLPNIDGTVPLSQAYQQFEPRGYKLVGAYDPKNQFEDLADAAKLAAGLSRKRRHFGFSREEVVMYGGLSCTPCRPSNLSDPFITTIFRQENFFNTPQDVYDELMPALKLAEKFIIDRTQIQYWSTLAFGKRVIDKQLTAQKRVCHERIVTTVDVTDAVYDQTMNLLNRLGKLVEFRFPRNDAEFETDGCFGYTLKAGRYWNLAPQHHEYLSKSLWPAGIPFAMARPYGPDLWEDGQIINLHPDLFVTAKRFIATRNVDPAHRLRFHFWFAVNLCHELAHVFELKCAQANFERTASACDTLEDFKMLADPRFGAGSIEAYWGDAEWAEAGAQWEWQTFGGRVHPLVARTDASLGMILFNADGRAKPAVPNHLLDAVGTCIQMGFIEEIQQQSFWSRLDRTLKFPQGSVRALGYPVMPTMSFRDYLTKRDEEIAEKADVLTDPNDIALMNILTKFLREDTTNPEERPTKRQKVSDERTSKPRTIGTRPIKNLPKRGRLGQRLGQPLIRRYLNKRDADAKALREEAMAHTAREEEQRGSEAAIERQAAEEARRYRSPSPGQKGLHEFFRYSGEDPDDDGETGRFIDNYVDPATRKPEDLTLVDKWTIAEEYVCLLMNWEPVEFLSQRQAHPDWRPLDPFNPDDLWTQETMDYLFDQRQKHPRQSWPERRAQAKALYEQKKMIASRMGMIDELLTLLGFSRIDSHRMFNETGKFPAGITLHNWPAYKPMLDAFRLTQQIQSSSEYRQAVNHGHVVPGATGAGLVAENNKVMVQAPFTVDASAKITDYFTKALPTDARTSQESTKSVPSDLPGLGKTVTPEEMIHKYEEWVVAGADMVNRPPGLHPSQLLSARLGGSLRAVLPSELAEVVEERTRRLEAEREERRRQGRASAAEQRQ